MQRSLHSEQYAHLLDQLREARRTAGMTQQTLAERLRVHQTVVSKCEQGVRRLDLLELREWVQALGQTLPDFVAALEDRLERHRDPAQAR